MYRLAGITLSAAALLGSATWADSPAASAPVTLVQNVNEPGLNPYTQIVNFTQNSAYCYHSECTIEFPVVPAGKRLVVTYASANFSLAGSNSTLASVALTTNANDQNQVLLPVPVLDGLGKFYIAASPVTFYVNAGARPMMILGGQFMLDSGGNSAQVALTGYYVNL